MKSEEGPECQCCVDAVLMLCILQLPGLRALENVGLRNAAVGMSCLDGTVKTVKRRDDGREDDVDVTS